MQKQTWTDHKIVFAIYLKWSLHWQWKLHPPTLQQQWGITTISCPYVSTSESLCICEHALWVRVRRSVFVRALRLRSVHQLACNIIEWWCLHCSPRKPLRNLWKRSLLQRAPPSEASQRLTRGQTFYLMAHMLPSFTLRLLRSTEWIQMGQMR